MPNPYEIDETISDFIVRVLSDNADSIEKCAIVIATTDGHVVTHSYKGLWDWELRGLLETAMDPGAEED